MGVKFQYLFELSRVFEVSQQILFATFEYIKQSSRWLWLNSDSLLSSHVCEFSPTYKHA